MNIKYYIIVIIAIAICGCAAHSHNSAFISQWSNAILISPDDTGKKWHETINVSDDISVLLTAQSGIFGFAKILYSDEKKERYVYRFSGYSNIQEIRIEYDNTQLFVLLNTTCPRLLYDKECNILKIYDLKNRIPFDDIELESDDIQIDEVIVN